MGRRRRVKRSYLGNVLASAHREEKERLWQVPE